MGYHSAILERLSILGLFGVVFIAVLVAVAVGLLIYALREPKPPKEEIPPYRDWQWPGTD